MSVLINEAQKNFYNKEVHLYLFEVTCSKAYTNKAFKPFQVYAVCKGHAMDKAIKLKHFPVGVHCTTILGQAKQSLEDRYFRRYGKQLKEVYNIL